MDEPDSNQPVAMLKPDNFLFEPQDPRHRQLIQTAIKARDKMALAALKGRTDKPIRYITGGFYYFMREAFTISNSDEPDDKQDEVAIYNAKTRLVLGKFANLNSGKDGEAGISSEYLMPEDIYNFLL